MRRWSWLVGLILAALLCACTATESGSRHASAGRSHPASSAQPAIVGGLPATARAHDLGHTAWSGRDVVAVSHAVSVTPSGPLAGPTALTLALERPLSPDAPVVVATRETDRDTWTYLPASVTADGEHVRTTVRHFSIFTALTVDTAAALSAFKSDFVDGVDAGITAVDVPRPKCADEDAARKDGYHVRSSGGTTVYWCLGLDQGQRTLTVVNRRNYPLDVAHPHMDVITDKVDYGSLSQLSRLDVGGDAVIAPNGSATFNADLSPGGAEGITTQIDGLGQSLYALQVGVTSLIAILTRFGANPASTPKAALVVDKLLTVHSCATSLGKGSGALVAGCFSPADILDAFGTKGLLLAPLLAAAPLLAFFRSEFDAIVDVVDGHDRYGITLSRDEPSFARFAGSWTGHTRNLVITASGHALENIGDGCCDPELRIAFTLSDPHQSGSAISATATATAVKVLDPSLSSDYIPDVGDKATVTLSNGVITESLTGTNYCNEQAGLTGVCGA